MGGTATEQVPVSAVDPFSDEFLADPFRWHGELREAGPVVRFPALSGGEAHTVKLARSGKRDAVVHPDDGQLNLPRHGHVEMPGGESYDYFAWLLSIVRRARSR